jgi:hypothetical protein
MAKVESPLFSSKASGDFGKEIQFRCGRFVVKKPILKDDRKSEWQNLQRELFKDGAEVWKNTLTSGQKESWKNFAKSVIHDKGYFTIPTPLGPIYVGIGQKEKWKECIENGGFNGYQYFQSCYLRFGPAGWSDYPDPPSFP